jgi:hypothetical protein
MKSNLFIAACALGLLGLPLLGADGPEPQDRKLDASPAGATKALAVAGRKLNGEYHLLRAALTQESRSALMQEQIEWSRECNAITDPWQKSRFVETRANAFKSFRMSMQ